MVFKYYDIARRIPIAQPLQLECNKGFVATVPMTEGIFPLFFVGEISSST